MGKWASSPSGRVGPGGRGVQTCETEPPFFFMYYQKHEFYIPTFFCFLVQRCLLLNQTYTVLRTAKERNIWPFGDGEKVMFYLSPPSIFAQPSFLRIRGKRGAYHNYSARPIHAKSIIIPIVLGSEFSRPILISFFLANPFPPSSRPFTLLSQT